VKPRLFGKALAVQAAVLALPFVLLALTLERGFFEDWGWLTGPVLWLLASAVTARILALPLGYTLACALAGGVAGTIVFLVASHGAGMAAALLVFAASCSAHHPEAQLETALSASRGDGI
jgi:hypothetical protein